MKEAKKQYRIGHVAQEVGVEKFVIRFWEKEFKLAANRSGGGQRYYEDHDINNFKQIKTLLYDQGLTIAGARKMLENDTPELRIGASPKTTMYNEPEQTNTILPEKIIQQLLALQKQLIKLKEVL